MKTIEIVIDSKGETQIETRGFAGPKCQEASRFVQESLGRTVAQRLTAPG